MKTYILDDDGNPVEETNFIKWGDWFETSDRILEHECAAGMIVSTVFLGVEHPGGTLFETAVFDSDWVMSEQRRYRTREQAIDGHRRIVEALRTRN